MMLIQAWISKPSQLYKCECGLLLLSMHFSQYNEEDNILSLRFIPRGIFEFCRQKKLLESYGPVGNTFPPSLLAYNSRAAKLVLSKLPKTFTFGPMSIKKMSYLLRIALWSCTKKFIFTLSSQWTSTIQLRLYHLQQYTSGKTKDGVCFSIEKIFVVSYQQNQSKINFLKISQYIIAI